MKYKLLRCNDELHLLLASGDIKVLSIDEAREYVLNFDTLALDEPADPSVLTLLEQYEGTPLVTLTDDLNLIVHDSSFLRELLTIDSFSYDTAQEFADKHGRQRSIVLRLCKDGRLPGAIRKGNAWYIPKDTEYPKDCRSGRDMSKRYYPGKKKG